jgi:hypothetical protein
MTTIPAFTSVPGQLVPGMGQPALIANEPPATTYPYYGHVVLYYLDYLDVVTEETLVARPGGSYLMTPVNSRHGLTVPPPDGRWVAPGFGPFFLRPRLDAGRVVTQPGIHEIRALAEKSRAASGWYEPRIPAQPQPRYTGGAVTPAVPQPSQMQGVRARLEEARVAHGHYAPGGCKACMGGGTAG